MALDEGILMDGDPLGIFLFCREAVPAFIGEWSYI